MNIYDKIAEFKDPTFKFDEEKHQYTYKGKQYTSVTTYIKKFCDEFDSEYWSKKKAKERLAKEKGVKEHAILDTDPSLQSMIDEIIGEWDKKRDISCDLGTDVHKYIEERFTPGSKITRESFVYNPEILVRIDKFEQLYDSRLNTMKPLAQELRIFSKTLKIAGTIDALFVKDGKIWILDWKTNGKFTTDKDRCYNMLKPPFQAYWENELNKYSIQLNLYKLILAEWGIPIEGCAIVYIPPDPLEAKIYKTKSFEGQLESYFGVDYISNLKNKEVNLIF